ncbi:hypothetical protein, partial [Pseudomonas sp.]|uniref:hypothetical protein n=1 Tax=Pseudomonas sp. TaxID=306 RepID=UPI003FD8A0C7
GLQKVRDGVRHQAVFAGFPGGVHLHEHIQLPSFNVQATIQRLGPSQAAAIRCCTAARLRRKSSTLVACG